MGIAAAAHDGWMPADEAVQDLSFVKDMHIIHSAL